MSRASIDESIRECRKCQKKVAWPLSHYCDKKGRRDLFDEHALRREIEGHWGKNGAHAEVYRMLLKRLDDIGERK